MKHFNVCYTSLVSGTGELGDIYLLVAFLDDYLHQNSLSSGFGSPSYFERRGSQMAIASIQLSYSSLEKQSIFRALSKLLKVYQTQIIQFNRTLPLKRDRKTDLYWIDTIIKLCQL